MYRHKTKFLVSLYERRQYKIFNCNLNSKKINITADEFTLNLNENMKKKRCQWESTVMIYNKNFMIRDVLATLSPAVQ